MTDISVLKMRRATRDDISTVQRLFDLAPDYTRRVDGRDPQPDEGEQMFAALPPNKTQADKLIYIFDSTSDALGCADVIRGYPSKEIAWIGLLMFSKAHQSKGFGKRAYSLLEDSISKWSEIKAIRLSVVMTNSEIIPFWKKQGFIQIGELRPYKGAKVETSVMIMEKILRP